MQSLQPADSRRPFSRAGVPWRARLGLIASLILAASAAPLALVGCGETSTPPREQPRGTAPPEKAERRPATSNCGEHGGARLERVHGDIPCGQMHSVAGRYNPQGERVQELGGWVCEGGSAMTRPVVFTCSSGDKEFVAKEKKG